MISSPNWLPPGINTNGIWEIILKKLYKVFDNDFIINKCHFDCYEIIFNDRKIDSPYEEGFWHLITKINYDTNQREPDFPRAQKLPWCKPTIENHSDSIVKYWDYKEEDKRIKTYIWLENYDYIVIIEKRTTNAFLTTAMHVSGQASRHRLINKYLKRIGI
jgi:hypothetical protein